MELPGFRGGVLRPDDPAFDGARLLFNRRFDRRPAAIARPVDTADAAVAVRVARDAGVRLAVRGGGHNFAGYAAQDGGVVLDTRDLRALSVDPVARVLTVGTGYTWGEVDGATHRYGLATSGGSMSKVGIGGFTLGTGLGWLGSSLGLAGDNLLGATVVTAGGDIAEASQTEEPQLYWALRGGTGNFGIVTAMRFRLYPVHTVYAGTLVFAADDAARVLRSVRDATVTMPPELTWAAVCCLAPAGPPWPEAIRGRPALLLPLCWSGAVEAGERMVGPIRAAAGPAVLDTIGPLPYPAFQASADASAPDGSCWDVRSEWLSTLDDGAIDALVAAAVENTSPLSEVLVRPLGGAIADGPDTPFSYRSAGWLLEVLTGWRPGDERVDRYLDWMRTSWQRFLPVSAGGPCISHIGVGEGPERVRAAYRPAVWDQLRLAKRRYDPDGFFAAAQPLDAEPACS